MFEVKILSYEDLSGTEKEGVPNNGAGKEYATHIKVIHNGETILLDSDAMEPEDATFGRDLSWIPKMFRTCYELGKKDAYDEGSENTSGL